MANRVAHSSRGLGHLPLKEEIIGMRYQFGDNIILYEVSRLNACEIRELFLIAY